VIRLALALSLALAGSAFAQEIMDRGAWFESLKQPGTGMSCCSYVDCRVTASVWQAGQWWARLPEGGPLVPIPPEIVLTDKSGQGPDGEAVLCSGVGNKLFCFVPPALGF
jgi:hypothetical protein